MPGPVRTFAVVVDEKGNEEATHAVLLLAIYSRSDYELPHSLRPCQTLPLTVVQAVVPPLTPVFASHPSSLFGSAALLVPPSPSSHVALAYFLFPTAFSSEHPHPPSLLTFSPWAFLIFLSQPDLQNILDPVSSSQPHSSTSSARLSMNSAQIALDPPGKHT